jgi:cytidylate kinase
MTAITISRESGSEGDYLAMKIAKTLGYHFVDKEQIGEILSEYGFVEFDKEYETLPGFWAKFDAQHGKRRELMVELLNKVVQALAVHGDVVIVGRSGFSILSGYADVFHIRLQSPFADRVKRFMTDFHITHDEAIAAVEESDKVKATFVEGYYKVSWDAAHAFDLVINTSKIAPDLALNIVVDAVKAFVADPKIGKPTTQVIEVDPVIMEVISSVLGCKIMHPMDERVFA